jgi:putative endonuclease
MASTIPDGDQRRALGAAGERTAADYLARRGFRILESNVRCRFGEIDIVAVKDGMIVFVEVKSNRGGAYGLPEEMVTPAKRRRLSLLATWYLQRRGWLGRPARFDVVAVDWEGGSGAAAPPRHYPDAFYVEGCW